MVPDVPGAGHIHVCLRSELISKNRVIIRNNLLVNLVMS